MHIQTIVENDENMEKNSENHIEEATSEPGVNHEEAMLDEEK